MVGIGGFGGCSAPDDILREMAKSYSAHGTPKNLCAVCGVSPGDLSEDGWGLSIIKAPGLVTSIYAAHVGMPPAVGRAVSANQIAGYTVPLGVYGHLLRAIASRKPGVITKIGLHTFCDPRLEGCKVNELARESGREVVSLINIDGTEYLHYKPFRLDACIIRGSYADEYGNISLEEEAIYSEQAAMAAAVHNNGGTVIVQVKGIFRRGVLDPRHVADTGRARRLRRRREAREPLTVLRRSAVPSRADRRCAREARLDKADGAYAAQDMRASRGL